MNRTMNSVIQHQGEILRTSKLNWSLISDKESGLDQHLINPKHISTKLNYEHQETLEPVVEETIAPTIGAKCLTVVSKLDDEKKNFINKSKGEQDFETIRQKCFSSGSLFEDPEFPANDESLFFSRRADRTYEWLRPKEICADPHFYVDGFSRFDVHQGELGDCWLLAATANLTQHHELFSRVVCDDNSFSKNYAGIFHFRFWQYGKWVEVIIDDRLPTYRGKLMFMHSREKNEFWSALLEKAYAKLHGSYEALKGGQTCEALEDFTGGVTETYALKEVKTNIFNNLEKGFERSSMMACYISAGANNHEEKTPQGLILEHAYSITKLAMVDIVTPNTSGKIPLLRLRNPWGDDFEWNGAWSDKSPEWQLIPEHAKNDIGLTFDYDGEFWMSYRDFMKYFDHLEICNLSPDSLTEADDSKKKWNASTFEGEWVSGVSAGGCRNFIDSFHRNPQYVMKVSQPDVNGTDMKCTVVVALMQKNHRSRHSKGIETLSIGFALYKVSESNLEEKPLKRNFFEYNAFFARSDYKNVREVCHRFRLPPGNYLIIPTTFEPEEEGEFLIRVFSESCNTFEENDDTVEMGNVDSRISVGINPAQRSAIEKLYYEVAGSKREIGWVELKQVLDHSMQDVKEFLGFSKDMCRSMVAIQDDNRSGKLDLQEFIVLLNDFAKWKAAFKLHDIGNTYKLNSYELRSTLQSAGYHLNNQILTSLVHRYGSPDKTIEFDDFIMCAVKVKAMIEYFDKKDSENTNQATFSKDEWITKTLYS